ncbi:MAG TPA: hypothetical protein ENN29_02120 [Candidatus Hydrogenedentes bacterium]|nr:hypothetical protein [Candidatus Hydrogenedentota bacterium]
MRALYVLTIVLLTVFVFAPAHGEQWFKGGLHLHSLWSDGDAAPEVVTAWYKERGWHFICYTDHNILLEGDTYKPIMDDADLTPARVEAIREQFGDDWVQEEEHLGRQRMRLKTYEELKAHFEEPGRFLVMHGEEITTLSGNPHVNAINVLERTGGLPKDGMTERIELYMKAVTAQAEKHQRLMFSMLNHPNFANGVTIEEALPVKALRFFEVFNGHPSVNNWGHEEKGYPSTDRFWDVLLTLRLQEEPSYMLYGLATDDAHNYFNMGKGANPGRGWVMVLAGQLAPEALLTSIMKGDFYASTGVLLDNIRRDESGMSFTIMAEPGVTYTTQFFGTRRGFDTTSTAVLDADGNPKERASRIYSDEIGALLSETTGHEPSYTFEGDELYVRAKITSDKPHPNPFKKGDVEMAWVQPATAP